MTQPLKNSTVFDFPELFIYIKLPSDTLMIQVVRKCGFLLHRRKRRLSDIRHLLMALGYGATYIFSGISSSVSLPERKPGESSGAVSLMWNLRYGRTRRRRCHGTYSSWSCRPRSFGLYEQYVRRKAGVKKHPGLKSSSYVTLNVQHCMCSCWLRGGTCSIHPAPSGAAGRCPGKLCPGCCNSYTC